MIIENRKKKRRKKKHSPTVILVISSQINCHFFENEEQQLTGSVSYFNILVSF